ncbi:MAG TPA: hypothetical protein PKD53_12805 [Chloroflexaceae bacterium]|nr:hypothetical protein [Chloroflexaceae bacterium]
MHLRRYWRIEAKRPDEPHWAPLTTQTDAEGIEDEARARELAAQAREGGGGGQEIRLVRVEEYVEPDI